MKRIIALLLIISIFTACGDSSLDELNFLPLEELPEDYTWEQAAEDGVYVNIHGIEEWNRKAFDSFSSNVKAGKPAFVRVMRYTAEGDPVLSDVIFNGEIFTVIEDFSRDKWGSGDIETTVYTPEEWEEVRQYILPK